MAHKLLRMKSKLLNTPHLIDEASFEAILDYLNKRMEGGAEITPPEAKFSEGDDGYSRRYLYNPDTQTAVMYIDGPLTNKATGWEAYCGGTSYEGLKMDFEEAIERGVKTVSFMASSGGGEAGGMIDSANYIRSLADQHDVKIITYVEDIAASACYGLACVSDEIVAQSDSEIGSIGVLVRLTNNSKEMEKIGREVTYITAGKSKVPFKEDGSWDKAFLEDIQYKVDSLYEDFTSHVAAHRNMSVESVRNTEAKTFLAKDALENGLVDKVMTVEQFYNYLADVSQQRSGEFKTNTSRIFKATDEEFMKLAEMEAALEAANTQLTEAQASVAELSDVKAALTAAVAEKEDAIKALATKVEELEAAQEETKVSARRSALSEVVAEDKLESTLASMSVLDDEAFNTVVGSLSASRKAVEESAMFQELGADEDVVTEAVVDSAVDYTKAAIAARIK